MLPKTVIHLYDTLKNKSFNMHKESSTPLKVTPAHFQKLTNQKKLQKRRRSNAAQDSHPFI
jgi:hypothetical protein